MTHVTLADQSEAGILGPGKPITSCHRGIHLSVSLSSHSSTPAPGLASADVSLCPSRWQQDLDIGADAPIRDWDAVIDPVFSLICWSVNYWACLTLYSMSCDPPAYLGSRMFIMKHWFACISYVCRLEHTDTVSQQRYYILNLTKSGYLTMLRLTPQPGNVGAGYNVQTVSRWRWSHTLQEAANDPSVFTITETGPTRAFSWLKAPTSAFTFKTILRHYAEQALTHGK